ncbi:MAG: tetratricopeptide repeat protein, partial [Gemmataceae bacterium]
MADMFTEAMEHLRANRLDLAAILLESALADDPKHADALNLLGVVAHKQGDHEQAVKLIRRALDLSQPRAAYFVNLAAALRGLERFDEAAEAARAALRLDANLLEAYLHLTTAHRAAGRLTEAEAAARGVAERWPEDSRGPQALGDCLREQGRTAEAIAAYREALRRNPDDLAANMHAGTLLLAGEDQVAAEPYLRRAAELLPGAFTVLSNYAACLIKLNREREALV